MIAKETLQTLALAATVAPSIDNCQPWRIRLHGNRLTICLDEERASFFGDYAFTGSYVTIGCMLENIAIAASSYNLKEDVVLFPEGLNGPVASVSFTENGGLQKDQLIAHINTRCTNRRPYRSVPLDASDLAALQGIVPPSKGQLKLFTDRESMKKLFKLSADVDSVIFSHHLLHENLFKWIRWDNKDAERTKDGMPLASLELDMLVRQFFRLISSWNTLSLLNRIALNRLIGLLNSSLLLRSSAVGLIIMDTSENVDFIEGGRFLERVWLTAQAHGLAFQPFGGMPFLLTRIIKAGSDGFTQKQYELLTSVFERLKTLAGITDNNAMIMLFRTGYAPPPSGRTIRRPLSEVMI